MAIWPFGRRGKRHTMQLDTDPRGDVVLSHDGRHSLDEGKLGRKPSRKQSKRRKNRHSQPVDDYPTNYPPSSASQTELNRPVKAVSHSYTAPNLGSQTLSRKPSLQTPKRNESPAVLKKRLSKRKAYEIAREREIRLMASTPIDIPRRATTPLPGDPMQIDSRRTHSALSRHFDRHRSNISLSIQESAHSSVSDFAEAYTFKVNGFAAWTPRPVIRYVEASPRTTSSRNNQRTPEPADRRTTSPTLELSEENLRSKKRIDELADDLDAGALRELMERDRRRRGRKEIEDHEKLLRKLQRTAHKQPKSGTTNTSPKAPRVGTKNPSEDQRNDARPENRPESQPEPHATSQETEEAFLADEPQGSWLRGGSRDGEADCRESPESVHVVGNIDDSSIREQKAGQRLSFGPSQDMAMSQSTLSASLSPSRHGLSSQASSQFYRMARESASDLSRGVDSERRLSDVSGRRVSTITSIFRRGSSRLKRSYRERFPDRSPPPLNNVSNESFFKVNTQPQPAAPYTPPKVLLGPSSFKRSQSKFTEHFGDEPLSPPDSRIQSPDIPDDEPVAGDRVPDLQSGSYYPIPGAGTDGPKNRHHSLAGGSLEDDPDNVPLSQSLASIDSEGSWMSGQFLRRISQKPVNSARQSLNSSRMKTDEGVEKSSKSDDDSADTQYVAFGPFPGETKGESSNATDKDVASPHQPVQVEETWHEDIAKRPVLVTPPVRPKSTEGLLNNVRSLSPISAEEQFSPIEGHSTEILFSTAHDTTNHTQAPQ
ncbi:uncharacterized protein BJX67DRAFT_297927 [Aspergillus lucknowensis]|uniref:Uncharacterized protein n=1 Tax=Aspergillus lucknowensis TaxID=176173 RepID=A0ABR4LCQ4_9EURO